MYARILKRIRDAVWRGDYQVTIPHFLEELAEDDLLIEDAETVILTGRIVRRQSGARPGVRYILRGQVSDGRTVEIVVRMTPAERPLFITVYVVES